MNKSINNQSATKSIIFDHELLRDIEYCKGVISFPDFVIIACKALIAKTVRKPIPTSIDTRKCCRCHNHWPIVCYQKNKNKKDGYALHCKCCESIRKAKKLTV